MLTSARAVSVSVIGPSDVGQETMRVSRSPVVTTEKAETSSGMVKECQIGIWLSRVVPVLSIATAAICEPLAGTARRRPSRATAR